MGIKAEVEKNNYLDSDGKFTAKLIGVEEKPSKFKDPALQWTFEVLNDSEHGGKLVTGLTSKKITPGNKTSDWIRVLDPDVDLEIGSTFDFDDLKGKICRVLVDEKEGDITYYNVIKIRRLKEEEQQSLDKYLEKSSSKPKEEKLESKSEKRTEEKKKPADDDIDF